MESQGENQVHKKYCIYINLNLTLNLREVRSFQSLCSPFLDRATNVLGT